MHEDTAAGYDAIADEYCERLSRELDAKPFDRAFLESLATKASSGPILDVGCGPGHVTRFLDGLGRESTGVDLSERMVTLARKAHPRLSFRVGDLCDLPFEAAAFAAAIAFYSIIHLAPDELVAALAELRRILVPGGVLGLSFHVGDEVRHVDELWGVRTNLDFRFIRPDVVRAALTEAGFVSIEAAVRGPYPPEVEAQTQRCYMLAFVPVP